MTRLPACGGILLYCSVPKGPDCRLRGSNVAFHSHSSHLEKPLRPVDATSHFSFTLYNSLESFQSSKTPQHSVLTENLACVLLHTLGFILANYMGASAESLTVNLQIAAYLDCSFGIIIPAEMAQSLEF